MEKLCVACGVKIEKGKYCSKHRAQMRRYGFIKERTLMDKNEIKTYDNYAEIVLYDINSKEVARTKISLDKVESIKPYKWCFTPRGYVLGWVDSRMVKLHRFITNAPKNMVVDHWDHDPLNNTNENLRVCTNQQNQGNKRLLNSNKSGVTGVYLKTIKGKEVWKARIKINKESQVLGCDGTFEDAVRARREAEEKYFGEFAYNKLKPYI